MRLGIKLPLFLLALLLLDLAFLSYIRQGRCYSLLIPLRRYYNRKLHCATVDPVMFWRVRKMSILLFVLGLALLPGWGSWGVPLPFLLLLLPDLWIVTAYSFSAKDRQKEIRFLKRLFILNGSVEPCSFTEVMGILQDHAYYLKDTFNLICRERERNNLDMLEVYKKIDREVGDLELRLFLEKISQADRIHFSEGVRSMQTDLSISKLIRQREARRRKESIELSGIFCGMALAGVLTYAMLLPWLSGSAFLFPS